MAEEQQWFAGKPEENFGLSLASDTEAHAGHLAKARELTKRSVDSAIRADSKETGAIWLENAALREAAFGNLTDAKQAAAEGLKLVPTSQGVEVEAALAYAMADDAAQAELLAQDLNKRFPLNTQMQSLWLPAIQAQLAVNRKDAAGAINHLQPASPPIEYGVIAFVANLSCLYPTHALTLLSSSSRRCHGQILSVLPEPAATIFAVASFTGARRGEIRGLLWENYRDGEIQVTRSIWRGHITEPKTQKSRGSIPVISPLAIRLGVHRARSGKPSTGVMFPNQNGKPMDLGNLLNRSILPALNRCVVCGKPKDECRKPRGNGGNESPDHDFERDKMLPEWHGWHAARRGLGTNLYRLGVPEKTIQAILRHANVSTTNTYYIKSAADDTRLAMGKLERLVIGNAEATTLQSGNELATPEAEAPAALLQ